MIITQEANETGAEILGLLEAERKPDVSIPLQAMFDEFLVFISKAEV